MLDDHSPYDQHRYMSRHANESQGTPEQPEQALASAADEPADSSTLPETDHLNPRGSMARQSTGRGRARSEKIMLRLGTSIEIDLRDQLRAYAAEHNMTIVDIVDAAVRARLARDGRST
jgi:hypothetical protein